MDIKKVRKILGIDNSWIAKQLGFKSTKSYTNSSAKKRYENLIVKIYIKSMEQNQTDKKPIILDCDECGLNIPVDSEIEGLKEEDFIMSCERKECPITVEHFKDFKVAWKNGH